jgi:hypothetical protein
MTMADFHPEATKEENHLSLKECLRSVTPRWMPNRLPEVMKSGEMCTESCVVLDLHAATKDNIAGRTHTGKSTTDYAQPLEDAHQIRAARRGYRNT